MMISLSTISWGGGLGVGLGNCSAVGSSLSDDPSMQSSHGYTMEDGDCSEEYRLLAGILVVPASGGDIDWSDVGGSDGGRSGMQIGDSDLSDDKGRSGSWIGERDLSDESGSGIWIGERGWLSDNGRAGRLMGDRSWSDGNRGGSWSDNNGRSGRWMGDISWSDENRCWSLSDGNRSSGRRMGERSWSDDKGRSGSCTGEGDLSESELDPR